MNYPYQKAALGGTFDHLHHGHEILIGKAFAVAEKVVIGIMAESNCTEKLFTQSIQSYEKRHQALKEYVGQYFDESRVQIIALRDAYGPTLTDQSIDSLIVSEMTIKSAHELNHKRTQNQLSELSIITVPTQLDQNEEMISSTAIRSGKINRQGMVYRNLFSQNLLLKPEMRPHLQQPQGQLMAKIQDINVPAHRMVIGVGDRVIQEFHQANIPFTHALIDGHIERQLVGIPDHAYNQVNVLHAENPPGYILPEAVTTVSTALLLPQSLVIVDGEEDLLVFPAVLLAPLNSLVVYGQPRQGIVAIHVNETSKNRLVHMMRQAFTESIIEKNNPRGRV
jgi:cytidyltransferase-like protein